MSVLQSLRQKPFHLDDVALAWVEKTKASLTLDEKVRQLFVQISMGNDLATIEAVMAGQPGGIHRFAGADPAEAWKATRHALELAKVPPFVTGDLEGGGPAPAFLTPMQSQLGLAAANDLELSRKSLEIMARETSALGYNWTFTPVVDINKAFQSAVVGTRSSGTDVDKILAQALVHVKTVQANGFAATAKHWPGEGYDQRDQHLVTTINPLTIEDWEATFGRLYRGLIDAGVMSVMSAHIAFPAWMEKAGIPDGLERYRPASISSHLNEGLLRGHLGFNGLIISDATSMAGLGSFASPSTYAAEIIANGCDMFLFTQDFNRDQAAVLAGCQSGFISAQRLDDAVTRVLGLKAALGLHVKSIEDRMPPMSEALAGLRRSESLAIADQTTSKSITLVKDVRNILPLSPDRYKRVVLIDSGAPSMLPFHAPKKVDVFAKALSERGFAVRAYDPENLPTPENCDLLIYALATESSLIQSRLYIDWRREHGGFEQAMKRFWHDIPTVMISFGHPYHLFDAPRVPAYINAWSSIEDAQVAVVRKLCGNEPFEGVSPVDAFCGLPDARF
jgi:beta-N-acetylhexosaminidase